MVDLIVILYGFILFYGLMSGVSNTYVRIRCLFSAKRQMVQNSTGRHLDMVWYIAIWYALYFNGFILTQTFV